MFIIQCVIKGFEVDELCTDIHSACNIFIVKNENQMLFKFYFMKYCIECLISVTN